MNWYKKAQEETPISTEPQYTQKQWTKWDQFNQPKQDFYNRDKSTEDLPVPEIKYDHPELYKQRLEKDLWDMSVLKDKRDMSFRSVRKNKNILENILAKIQKTIMEKTRKLDDYRRDNPEDPQEYYDYYEIHEVARRLLRDIEQLMENKKNYETKLEQRIQSYKEVNAQFERLKAKLKKIYNPK